MTDEAHHQLHSAAISACEPGGAMATDMEATRIEPAQHHGTCPGGDSHQLLCSDQCVHEGPESGNSQGACDGGPGVAARIGPTQQHGNAAISACEKGEAAAESKEARRRRVKRQAAADAAAAAKVVYGSAAYDALVKRRIRKVSYCIALDWASRGSAEAIAQLESGMHAVAEREAAQGSPNRGSIR
jgi:hypothetical protein